VENGAFCATGYCQHVRMCNMKMFSYDLSDVKEIAKSVLPARVRSLAKRTLLHDSDFEKYRFAPRHSIVDDIRTKYNFDGDLLRIFANNQFGMVQKWHHYIPIYDRYFSAFRGKEFRLLEIGVSRGGSLQMWRDYFGPKAVIYGVDISEDCRQYDGVAGQVRIGSQADEAFLRSVVNEMGGLDIVIDDGSHRMRHIRQTLVQLFPLLNEGGVYLIEDLHTAYWRDFGGGYRSKANFFNFLLDVSHDLHRWYHREPVICPEVTIDCSGMHVHDSIVVLEKSKVFAPVYSRVGTA
jgi:hypothetical protein